MNLKEMSEPDLIGLGILVYLGSGFLVFLVTLAAPEIRTMWREAFSLGAAFFLPRLALACLIWPVRLLIFIKDCLGFPGGGKRFL